MTDPTDPSNPPPDAPASSATPAADVTAPQSAPPDAPPERAAASPAAPSAGPSSEQTPGATPEAAPPADPVAAAREVLAWCKANGASDDALVRLNDLRELLLRPELAREVLDAAEAVIQPLINEPAPRPVVHAHMIILLGTLLDIESQRDRVDTLFVAWMRHPASYGVERATPPPFQRPAFVQRLGDLLGWGTLDVTRDREPLTRFLAWLNTWNTKHKYQMRRSYEALRRNFPAPDLWKIVRLP